MVKTYKIIQWFKVDDKIIKSQRSTDKRDFAFALYEQGLKARMYRGSLLVRERGFN